ncbi:Gfo/Idh/MocA family oxidoreductase [Pseudonocardia sp.]|uniref:Gfo/Idh/MocA family protein n=1 Tax=Pseudonocardia sp. TaxID=60912 RepID=UPI00261D7D43|nr:Gfo/Idh/MocA family oxidoreductase [Pseudonocardia sp.]MCW2721077.1 Oxidoreductase [Pseudonocardia sp.]
MLNVCMVGHGMMGVWHSEALKGADCRLHTVVGRPPADGAAPVPTAGITPPSTREFAGRYGYEKWTTDLGTALDDPAVDIVIVAGPSETHADMTIAALEHGKHVLVEIPIAMNLDGAERVVATARERGLTLGVVHPMRFRPERTAVVERIHSGAERISHVQGRFFIHRLQNIGATGLQRSWTDNLLWHHTTHLVDLGLWMVAGGDMATVEDRIRSVYSAYPPIEPRTGIPMELVLVVETRDDQTIVCTGSYYSGEYIYETLAVTDHDSYRVDERRSTLTTRAGEQRVASEQENAELIAPDFVAAVSEGREPAVPGWSVLPAMRVLHEVQEEWDARHGARALPGRPVV